MDERTGSAGLGALLERLFNLSCGLSVLFWAVMGVLHEGSFPPSLPRIIISLLNLTVGILFIIRQPLKAQGSLWILAAAIPGVVIAGGTLRAAAPLSTWPLEAQLLFTFGGLFAVLSFFFLGRSFAILPALRRIVVRGPYRLVRHPAYAGELVMIAAAVVARPNWLTFVLFIGAVPLIVFRIIAEERLLTEDDAYLEYRDTVRYRLVPGIW